MVTSCEKTAKPEALTSKWYGLGGMLTNRKEPSEAVVVDCL